MLINLLLHPAVNNTFILFIQEGPALKILYKQFMAPRHQQSSPLLRSRPLEESLVWANEDE
jgi:hypothetical protein